MKVLCLLALSAVTFVSSSNGQVASEPQASSALPAQESLHPLTSELSVTLNERSQLLLEPGVRAKRSGSSISLSTYDGSPLQLLTSGRTITSTSASISGIDSQIVLVDNVTELHGIVLARRKAQEDTDNNLKSMQEAAKKLKSKSVPNQDNQGTQKKLRTRWLFQENPTPTAELFNTAAIQQLTHLSAIGF